MKKNKYLQNKFKYLRLYDPRILIKPGIFHHLSNLYFLVGGCPCVYVCTRLSWLQAIILPCQNQMHYSSVTTSQ